MTQKKSTDRWIYLIPTFIFLVISIYSFYSFPHTSEKTEINGNSIFVPNGESVVLSRYKTTIVLVSDGNQVSQSLWLFMTFHIKDITVTNQFQDYDFQKYFKSDINDGIRLRIRKVEGGIEIEKTDNIKIW